MKMDQHHDYSIDEHNACHIETPPARISSPRPCSVLARTAVPLRSAGAGTGSRVIAMLALVAGMSVMVGAHAAECPHGTIITAEDTVCTVPSGTGFVTVELWGAGGGSAAGSRDFGGAGGGGGGAYCSGMVAVDPGNSITLKVGRAGTGSVFQNVDGWKYGDNGGASTVTGPPGLAGFRAAGGKGGRGGKLPAIPLPLTVTLAWGGEGGDAEQCAITDVAINRLRYSGGRGGGTQGHAGGGGGSAYRNGNGYPGQDSTTNDSGLGGAGFGRGGDGHTGERGSAGTYPGGGAGASAVTPVTPVYIGNDGANGQAIFWFAPGYRVGGAIDPGFWADGLVLGLNGSEEIAVRPTGYEYLSTFYHFWTPLPAGNAYNVTIKRQPAGQTCYVNNASGTVSGNVGNVAVGCVDDPYYVSGSLYGLSQPGLVLGLFAGDSTAGQRLGTVTPAMAEESFAFAGSPVRLTRQYTVGVVTQPTGLTCKVANATFFVQGPITDVRVTCSPGKVVGGSVSGLYAGRSVALELADQLLVATNSDAGGATVNVDFFFPGPLLSGTAYNVRIRDQPLGQMCNVVNGSGTMGSSDVNSVSVQCAGTICTNLDVDGDQQLNPAIDGLILLRVALGLTGAAVLDGISFAPGTRNTWSNIRYYLKDSCGMPTND